VSDRIADLDQKLKAAGIPIQGLSGTRDHCKIVFDGEPTDEQRAAATAILKDFDWTERVAKPVEDIDVILKRLKPEDKQKILDWWLVEQVRADPKLPARAGVQSVSDEVVEAKAAVAEAEARR